MKHPSRRARFATMALTLSLLAALGTACTGDDDYIEALPVDASTDASVGDATLGDATPNDAGPPFDVDACVSCATDRCGPAILECYADATCTALLQCAVTSGCLRDDPSSCIPVCVADAGLEPGELVQQLVLITGLIDSCSGCLSDCGLGDASLPLPF